jgi:alkanesulfonate monooxygenase SsuD/methylene tetrahydromethanopterin reductase-like flavin-dependent oxidoreductase (luciferase family)
VPFPPLSGRYERLEETLQICRRMWSSGFAGLTARVMTFTPKESRQRNMRAGPDLGASGVLVAHPRHPARIEI